MSLVVKISLRHSNELMEFGILLDYIIDGPTSSYNGKQNVFSELILLLCENSCEEKKLVYGKTHHDFNSHAYFLYKTREVDAYNLQNEENLAYNLACFLFSRKFYNL